MKLSEQVVSLELAKRLKELGVKQEALYYWEHNCSVSDDEWTLSALDWHDSLTGEWDDCHSLAGNEHYAAFTVAELGEMLPMNVKLPFSNENGCWLETQKENGQWSVLYDGVPCVGTQPRNKVGGRVLHREVAPTEADARAKMLIYLIENKLLKV